MRFFKITLFIVAISTLTSCACGYRTIEPKSINYVSTNLSDNVQLEYKYHLLDKKYAKKESTNGVKLVAVKITNNSDTDLTFGNDIKFSYENGSEVNVLENEAVFKSLKQSPASYLFYLLLAPLNLTVTKVDSYGNIKTSSTPIGLIIGPGIAGGNMIAASSANSNFKNELLENNINGTVIKKGETKYGLIGIRTDSYDALKLKINKKNTSTPAIVEESF